MTRPYTYADVRSRPLPLAYGEVAEMARIRRRWRVDTLRAWLVPVAAFGLLLFVFVCLTVRA